MSPRCSALIALVLLDRAGVFRLGHRELDHGRDSWRAIAPLAAISRWYIVTLQDRIIMLEMKVRAAEILLNAGQDALLAKLSPKQIAALRFASDAELGLAARAGGA